MRRGIVGALQEFDEIRQAVRRYAAEQLAPHAAHWDRDKEFPREALKGRAAMGLYGVAIADGINGSERIVLSAGAFLSPGQKIKPVLVKLQGR